MPSVKRGKREDVGDYGKLRDGVRRGRTASVQNSIRPVFISELRSVGFALKGIKMIGSDIVAFKRGRISRWTDGFLLGEEGQAEKVSHRGFNAPQLCTYEFDGDWLVVEQINPCIRSTDELKGSASREMV